MQKILFSLLLTYFSLHSSISTCATNAFARTFDATLVALNADDISKLNFISRYELVNQPHPYFEIIFNARIRNLAENEKAYLLHNFNYAGFIPSEMSSVGNNGITESAGGVGVVLPMAMRGSYTHYLLLSHELEHSLQMLRASPIKLTGHEPASVKREMELNAKLAEW